MLLEEYVPLLFTLGWLVRTAYWQGQQVNTGYVARDALQLALLLLSALLGERAQGNEYVRGITMALLSWTPWHDALPGCSFVEESCEAQLSHLARACLASSSSYTVDQVCDLYVNLGAQSTRAHTASHHPVDAALQRQVNANLQALVSGSVEDLVRWVPWRSARTCVAEQCWPDEVPFHRLTAGVELGELQRTALHCLHVASSGPDLPADVVRQFNAHVPTRMAAERVRAQQALQDTQDAWEAAFQPNRRPRRAIRRPLDGDSSEEEAVDQRPRQRRRLTSPHFEEGLPQSPRRSRALPSIRPPSPTLVGIPDEPTDSD